MFDVVSSLIGLFSSSKRIAKPHVVIAEDLEQPRGLESPSSPSLEGLEERADPRYAPRPSVLTTFMQRRARHPHACLPDKLDVITADAGRAHSSRVEQLEVSEFVSDWWPQTGSEFLLAVQNADPEVRQTCLIAALCV
jgi:hypothetical protein